MKLEYFEKFGRLDSIKESFRLLDDRMLVELLDREEMRTSGGLIYADPNGYRNETQTNRPTFCIVLAVGEGIYDEDGKLLDPEFPRGSIILVNPNGLSYFSEFPGIGSTSSKIAIISPGNVGLSWPSVEAFQTFKETLSK